MPDEDRTFSGSFVLNFSENLMTSRAHYKDLQDKWYLKIPSKLHEPLGQNNFKEFSYIACVAGVRRGGKGERRAREVREDRTLELSWYYQYKLSLPSVAITKKRAWICTTVQLKINDKFASF